MSYSQITAKITDQTIQMVNSPLLASGSEGVLQVKCSFDALWDGYGKTAVFYRNKEQVFHVVMANGVATVPHEVLGEEGYFYFGVMGVADNTRTTEVVRLELKQGAITLATAETEEPTPDIYEQLLAAHGQLDTAVAVERARVDELVAMRSTTGAAEYNLSDEYISGKIYSNGASAFIEFNISKMSLVAGGQHYTDYCIQPGLGPLGPVELRSSHADINITMETPNAEGWARLLIENAGTEMYTTDMVTKCWAFYPLAKVYNSELADIRVGADGKTYSAAGVAVRQQMSGVPIIARFYSLDGEATYLCENYTHDELVEMLQEGRVVIAHLNNGEWGMHSMFCRLYTPNSGVNGVYEAWIGDTDRGWEHNPNDSDYFTEDDKEIWVEV